MLENFQTCWTRYETCANENHGLVFNSADIAAVITGLKLVLSVHVDLALFITFRGLRAKSSQIKRGFVLGTFSRVSFLIVRSRVNFLLKAAFSVTRQAFVRRMKATDGIPVGR